MRMKKILPFGALTMTFAMSACVASETDSIITGLRELGYTEAQINSLLSSEDLDIPKYIVENKLQAIFYEQLVNAPDYNKDLFFRYLPIVVKYANDTIPVADVVETVNKLYGDLGYRNDQFTIIANSQLTYADVKKLFENNIDPVAFSSLFSEDNRNLLFDAKYLDMLIVITDGRSESFNNSSSFNLEKIISSVNVLTTINFSYEEMTPSGLVELFNFIDTIVERSEELALGELGHTWESVDALNDSQKVAIHKKIEDFLNKYLTENADSIANTATLIKDKTPVISATQLTNSAFAYERNTLYVPLGGLPLNTTLTAFIANNLEFNAVYKESGNWVDIASLLNFEIDSSFDQNTIGRYNVRAHLPGTTDSIDELETIGKYFGASSNFFVEIIEVAPTFYNVAGDPTSGDSRDAFAQLNAVLNTNALTTIDNVIGNIKIQYAGRSININDSNFIEMKYYSFDKSKSEYVEVSRGLAIGQIHRIKIEIIFTSQSGKKTTSESEINISATDISPPLVIFDTPSIIMELGEDKQTVINKFGNITVSDNTTALSDIVVTKFFEIGGNRQPVASVNLTTANLNPNDRIKYIVRAEDQDGNVAEYVGNIRTQDTFAPNITHVGAGSSSNNPLSYVNNDIYTNSNGVENFVNANLASLGISFTDNDNAWLATNPSINFEGLIGANSYTNTLTYRYSITDRANNKTTKYIYVKAEDTQAPEIYRHTATNIVAQSRIWAADAPLEGFLEEVIKDNDYSYTPNGVKRVDTTEIQGIRWKWNGDNVWHNSNIIPRVDVIHPNVSLRNMLSFNLRTYDIEYTLKATDPTGNVTNKVSTYSGVRVHHGNSNHGNKFAEMSYYTSPNILYVDGAIDPITGFINYDIENGGNKIANSQTNVSSRYPNVFDEYQNVNKVINGSAYNGILAHVYTSPSTTLNYLGVPGWAASYNQAWADIEGAYGPLPAKYQYLKNGNRPLNQTAAYNHYVMPLSAALRYSYQIEDANHNLTLIGGHKFSGDFWVT